MTNSRNSPYLSFLFDDSKGTPYLAPISQNLHTRKRKRRETLPALPRLCLLAEGAWRVAACLWRRRRRPRGSSSRCTLRPRPPHRPHPPCMHILCTKLHLHAPCGHHDGLAAPHIWRARAVAHSHRRLLRRCPAPRVTAPCFSLPTHGSLCALTVLWPCVCVRVCVCASVRRRRL